jgi:hypothetical protein
MNRRTTIGIIVIAALALSAASGRAGAGGGSPIELTVPGRSSAYASIAAEGATVAIVWAAATPEGVTDIYLAPSHDAGRTFGAPMRVNDTAGAANVSGEQPPRVVLAPRHDRAPSIVVAWTAKGATGTRLLSATSDDEGRSFTHASTIPGSEAPGNRGWETIAADAGGRVAAIWLDHRDAMESHHGAASHAGQMHTGHGDADGAARAQRSKLYFARLGDPGAEALTGGVCYCCKTALTTGADGSIYAAWRHVYPGNIRDIAFTVSRDGGRTFAPPIRVSEDQWVLDGCPENGPTIAVDASGTVHVVWPTLVGGPATAGEPALALFHASTRDGREFSPRQQIPTEGTPRHPQIAIAHDGSMLVAWDQQTDGRREVVVAEAVPARAGASTSQSLRFGRVSRAAAERSEYPAIAASGGEFVLASTVGPAGSSVIRVERIGALR